MSQIHSSPIVPRRSLQSSEDRSWGHSTVSLPRCVLLYRKDDSPHTSADAAGTALIRRLKEPPSGRIAITVAAHHLPDPAYLGEFDSYEALAFIPDVIAWRWPLDEGMEPIPTWAGTLTEITAALTPNLRIQIRPVNLNTGASGPVIVSGTLQKR